MSSGWVRWLYEFSQLTIFFYYIWSWSLILFLIADHSSFPTMWPGLCSSKETLYLSWYAGKNAIIILLLSNQIGHRWKRFSVHMCVSVEKYTYNVNHIKHKYLFTRNRSATLSHLIKFFTLLKLCQIMVVASSSLIILTVISISYL